MTIRSVIFNNVQCKENIQIAFQFSRHFIDRIMDIRKSIEEIQYTNREMQCTNSILKLNATATLELK